MRVLQPIFTHQVDTASTAIASSSWSQFHSGITGPVKELEVYNGTSQAFLVAIGGSASEVQEKWTIFPNGNPSVPVVYGHNTRIAIKALSSATAGLIIINGYK